MDTNMHFMCKFEANRYGFRDTMAENLTFRNFVVFDSSVSFFKLDTDFFQTKQYWISIMDTNMHFMYKFEANRYGFHDAMTENQPFGTLLSF